MPVGGSLVGNNDATCLKCGGRCWQDPCRNDGDDFFQMTCKRCGEYTVYLSPADCCSWFSLTREFNLKVSPLLNGWAVCINGHVEEWYRNLDQATQAADDFATGVKDLNRSIVVTV